MTIHTQINLGVAAKGYTMAQTTKDDELNAHYSLILNAMGEEAGRLEAPVHTIAAISGLSPQTVQKVMLCSYSRPAMKTFFSFTCALALWLNNGRPSEGKSLRCECIKQAKALHVAFKVGGAS